MLKLLAVLMVVGIAGCSKSDPYAKYRDAQLKQGMTIAEIKQQFGEPDSFGDYWRDGLDETRGFSSPNPGPEYPYHFEVLNYGAFGAHHQKLGHITKHRLSLTFVNGELREWSKSTPIDGE